MAFALMWTPTRIAKMSERKILNDFDLLMVIEGTTGIGKSTLALQILKKIKFHKFKMHKDILYSQEELIKALKTRWKTAFLSDEAINVAFNRDFYQENQKNILKLFNMNRDHTNLIILCVPNFEDLDVKLKQLCRLRISVIERGLGVVHMKNPSIFCRDKWDSALNEKMERDWMARGKPPQFSKLTTFRGYVYFRPLTAKQEARYQAIKTRKRNEIYSQQELAEAVTLKSPTDRLIRSLFEGKIRNQEEFFSYCDLLDVEVKTAMKSIRSRLREIGASERIKDLFVDTAEEKLKKIEKDRITIDKLLHSL